MKVPPDYPRDDPWNNLRQDADFLSENPEEHSAKFVSVNGIVPFDAQLGEYPKKCVPELLRSVLFGGTPPANGVREAAGVGASPAPAQYAYAILDVAKVVNLPELLERSGLQHRCLFKGEALNAMSAAAPWIVRLEETSAFTRNLFTRSDMSWHLWDTEPGIFLRSNSSLDDLWRHFRKFTRVQDEAGKWYYSRFWEPRWARIMLRDMASPDVDRFLSGISCVVALGSDGRAVIISR